MSVEPSRRPTWRSEPLPSNVRVARSRLHGHGLFAACDLAPDDVITVTPVLVIDQRLPAQIAGHVYRLGDGRSLLPCGDGIMVNHRRRPSAHIQVDLRARTVSLIASRWIAAGEEITIDYAAPEQAGRRRS